MQINDITDAFFWWLEEIPVDELSCETAQKIVRSYRNREVDVMQACDQLEYYCEQVIREWMDTNRNFKPNFKKK